MITIDKSRFNAEQLAQYEQLLAIGKAEVDPEAAEKTMEEDIPDVPPKAETKKEEVNEMEKTEKSASPELTAALERLESLEKSYAMQEFTQIAKKYAALGENETELAQTLYDMKKSNPANYDAYIKVLDKSLDMVQKSGVFAEIGKSAPGAAAGDVRSKIEAKAGEIMKSAPGMDFNTAVAKAWESSPELMDEYDAAYQQR